MSLMFCYCSEGRSQECRDEFTDRYCYGKRFRDMVNKYLEDEVCKIIIKPQVININRCHCLKWENSALEWR